MMRRVVILLHRREPPSRHRHRETPVCRGIAVEEKKVPTGGTLHLYRAEAKK